jgi:hypothetical protein
MPARSVVAVLAAVTLALGLAAPTVAAPDDRARAELPAAASDRARQVLAEVRAIFEGDRPGADRASAHPHRDATLALRELMRVRDRLSGAERRQADAYLARPASTRKSCTSRICVHYSPGNVSPDGSDRNRVSDYVDRVRRTVDGVHLDYTGADYRAPLPDGSRGGDNRTDIYIRDIGSQGLYGYCTSEKQIPEGGPYNAWAYCVLDNNYAEPIFRAHTRLENLRVTAAHEYFHAVQFAYDALEDGWFMEATATWVEDELFDSINDNRQYLSAGPLGRPRVPLDKFEQNGAHQYGDWIFFRYLTERFPDAAGGLPTLVRDAWRNAHDSVAGVEGMYSMEAVENTLLARGTTFAEQFALFADGNRRPATTYDEGTAYRASPLWRDRDLTPTARTASLAVDQLDHQASATARFRPSGLTGPDWTLQIQVDMARRSRGSMAVLTEDPVGLPATTSLIPLDNTGAGEVEVPFSEASVSRVEVTLVNASTNTTCWQYVGPTYSCYGVPHDDDLPARVTVTAHR